MAIERDKALAQAREFVLGLYPPRDDRSHPHTTTEMREMLSQMLTIAEFLSVADITLDEPVLREILQVAQSIRDNMQ